MLAYALLGGLASIVLLIAGYQIAMFRLRATPAGLRAQRLALEAELTAVRAERAATEIEWAQISRIQEANMTIFAKRREMKRVAEVRRLAATINADGRSAREDVARKERQALEMSEEASLMV
jgi:hypothetical protein